MTQSSPWQIYRRLIGFARPYRWFLFVALLGMLIEAGAAGAFTQLMQPMIDETFVARNPKVSLTLPMAIIGLFIVRGIAGFIADTRMAQAGRSIARDLRVQVLEKYLRLPGSRFDTEPVPSMLVRLGTDSDQVAQAAIDAAKVMLQQSLQVIVMLGVMLWTSWRVTVAVLVLGPLLGWVMDKVGKRYRRISHRISESGADLLQAADQALSNHQEVKVYGAQDVEMRRYSSLADATLGLVMKVESTRSISSALVQLMGAAWPGGAAGVRRPRGDDRSADRGGVRQADVRDAGDHPGVENAHQRAEHAAAGRGLGRAPVRCTRCTERTRFRHARAGTCAGRDRIPRSHCALPRPGTTCAGRCHFHRTARHRYRDRGPFRQRQVLAHQADSALLRGRGRQHPARRSSGAGIPLGGSASPDRAGRAAGHAVRRHGRSQRRLRRIEGCEFRAARPRDSRRQRDGIRRTSAGRRAYPYRRQGWHACPAASASAWRLRARCSRTRRS